MGDRKRTLEGLEVTNFYSGKRIFVTGHTGFKGSWLCLWLAKLGAEVTGYALEPPTNPSLFQLARINELTNSQHGDVRDFKHLADCLKRCAPDVVFHLAAQPLVRDAYRSPIETYATNVMGTVHLLEAVRACPSVRAVVNVTTDKCYENPEHQRPFCESDPLGGFDPYSSSKACAELASSAYRLSFFAGQENVSQSVALATARAGNVLGGGDWAAERLLPDCFRALIAGEEIVLRNPDAVRPWQHVLEPLSGYLQLAKKLYVEGGAFAEAWNFGPAAKDCQPVSQLVAQVCQLWGDGRWQVAPDPILHEAGCLRLNTTKAQQRLGWQPRWNLAQALTACVDWVRAWQQGGDMRLLCLNQISAYEREER